MWNRASYFLISHKSATNRVLDKKFMTREQVEQQGGVARQARAT